jgi:hypothetical protein
MMVRLERAAVPRERERVVADQEITTAPIQAESAAAAAVAAMTGRVVRLKPAAAARAVATAAVAVAAALLQTAPISPLQVDRVGPLTWLEEEGAARPETTPGLLVLTQEAQQPTSLQRWIHVRVVQWAVAPVKKLPVKEVPALMVRVEEIPMLAAPAAAAAAFMAMLP